MDQERGPQQTLNLAIRPRDVVSDPLLVHSGSSPWTFSLQNCKKENSGAHKPPSLLCSVAASRMKYDK